MLMENPTECDVIEAKMINTISIGKLISDGKNENIFKAQTKLEILFNYFEIDAIN